MPESSDLPWFAGRPGNFRLYRVNRRPLDPNLFAPGGMPKDAFDHFSRVLAPGYEVVTGRRNQRRWKVGGVQVDHETVTLVGKLGWVPAGQTVVPSWSEDAKDWTASITTPQGGRILPFGFDGETRMLAVLSDSSTDPETFAVVFEKIIQANEMELLERTTEWSVEPILDVERFLTWLKAQEIVTRVSFTAKLPNPEPREAFAELAERMQARRARSHTETMVGDDETGLVGIEHDRDFKQAIAMGEQGFATLRGRGRTEGVEKNWSQRSRVATERVEELPSDWAGIYELIKAGLKSALRRYLDDGESGS